MKTLVGSQVRICYDKEPGYRHVGLGRENVTVLARCREAIIYRGSKGRPCMATKWVRVPSAPLTQA
jgi:hypothetical protein